MKAHYRYQADGAWQTVEMSLGPSSAILERQGKNSIVFRNFDGGLTRYRFAEDGSLQEMEHPDATHTFFRYDAERRQQRIELPEGQCLEWSYDEQGRIQETQRRQGCGEPG